jgi:hypothetical protein
VEIAGYVVLNWDLVACEVVTGMELLFFDDSKPCFGKASPKTLRTVRQKDHQYSGPGSKVSASGGDVAGVGTFFAFLLSPLDLQEYRSAERSAERSTELTPKPTIISSQRFVRFWYPPSLKLRRGKSWQESSAKNSKASNSSCKTGVSLFRILSALPKSTQANQNQQFAAIEKRLTPVSAVLLRSPTP